MDDVKRVVSDLVEMLEDGQKEVTNLVDTMHELQSYLDRECKSIVQEGLDRLLATVMAEANKLTGGWISPGQVVVVLISPESRVTVKEIYGDENSDPWLVRLKSEGFQIMRLRVFSSLIQHVKSKLVEGKLTPIIEFLKANA
jgi:mevalonate kinase